MYICPICNSSLELLAKEAVCSNGHCFNRAKQGYYHLLPVNKKGSKVPGDNVEMIKARHQFLESGVYLPLAEVVQQQISKYSSNILDLGCGEGYFSRYIKSATPQIQITGVDISKESIKLAAREDKTSIYCVASNFALPLADNSVDTILINFAPVKESELIRVLKHEGRVLRIVPASNHLFGLRSILYKNVRTPPSTDSKLKGFIQKEFIPIEFKVELSKIQKQNLMQMTPFHWKITPSVAEHYVESDEAEILSFQLFQFVKESS